MYCTVGDYLVMHLSELVRTSFIAATASVDQLKLAGYQALQVLTERGRERERERGRECVSVHVFHIIWSAYTHYSFTSTRVIHLNFYIIVHKPPLSYIL